MSRGKRPRSPRRGEGQGGQGEGAVERRTAVAPHPGPLPYEGRGSALLLVVLLTACTGVIGTGGTGGTGGGSGAGAGGGGEPACAQNRNDEVRLALVKACAGCHTAGNLPFFASLDAFESGLVYDARYVDASNPGGSLLIQLLEARATGSYPQMPPGQRYQELVDDGRATMSIAQLKEWIGSLPPPPVALSTPKPESLQASRVSAEAMVLSLLDQLGLTVADFVDTSQPDWQNNAWSVRNGGLFVWPNDWAPGVLVAYVSDSRARERFSALGGPTALEYRRRDELLSPAAMQTLVQVGQAWCKKAIEKPGNTAVLGDVTLADRAATQSAKIKANLGRLYLRMLGEPPAPADVDELYDALFLPYESVSTKAAWTAVCAGFVRHPLWLTY